MGGRFASWEAALRFFAALAVDEPLAVVLDEVPYLVNSTAGFASVVQAVWDHIPEGTKLMVVLTGSAVAMMEAMVGAGGALRGRATLTLRLGPLDPWEARAFLPRLEPAVFFEAYAATAGLCRSRWKMNGWAAPLRRLRIAATGDHFHQQAALKPGSPRPHGHSAGGARPPVNLSPCNRLTFVCGA